MEDEIAGLRCAMTAAPHFELVDPDSDDACACVLQYFAELAQRFDDGFHPGKSIPAERHQLTPPHGAFLVGHLDGEVVACGGLKTHAPGVAYFKRMWVATESRGQGLGRLLLAALEDEARRLDFTTACLETNKNLTEAIALYRSSGYREVDPFNDEPYAHHWFQKDLTAAPQ